MQVEPAANSSVPELPPQQNPGAKRLQVGAVEAGLWLGVMYALGFMVANAYLSQYEVVSFELFRVRYMAAAVLFLVLTAIPAGYALLVYREIAAPEFRAMFAPYPRWRRWLVWTGIVLLASVASFYGWASVIGQLSADSGFGWSGRSCLYFSSAALIALAMQALIRTRGMKPGAARAVLRDLESQHLTTILLISFAAIGLSKSFGTTIYPNLRPAYGGGAAWEGFVSPSDSTIPPDVSAALAGKVAVVDRDRDYVRLILCITSPERQTKAQAIELSRGQLAVIRVKAVVTLSAFMDSCKASGAATRVGVTLRQ